MEVLNFIARLLDLILSHIPVEEARVLLDEAAIRRANKAADIAEAAKF